MLGVHVFFRRYKTMILASLFFLYLGCGLTVSFLKIECVDALRKTALQNEQLNKVEYAVLILSNPANKENRQTIRKTWKNLVTNLYIENGEKLYKWNHTKSIQTSQPDFIKFYFVIGTKNLDEQVRATVESENEKYQDLLILENLEDSYKNLAFKMIQSLTWFSENLGQLKYVIKCDDDSFVRVDLIVADLQAYAPDMNAVEISEYVDYKIKQSSTKGLYWGYLHGNAHVYLSGKWEEKEWFLCDTYLPYALGGGYVISKNIVDFVARNADILSHYKSEDVSMGVWTAGLDINRVHDIRFDTEWKSRGCNNDMLVRHKQSPNNMLMMYETLISSKGEKLCKSETSVRKSYRYNWNVLPSSCCKYE